MLSTSSSSRRCRVRRSQHECSLHGLTPVADPNAERHRRRRRPTPKVAGGSQITSRPPIARRREVGTTPELARSLVAQTQDPRCGEVEERAGHQCQVIGVRCCPNSVSWSRSRHAKRGRVDVEVDVLPSQGEQLAAPDSCRAASARGTWSRVSRPASSTLATMEGSGCGVRDAQPLAAWYQGPDREPSSLGAIIRSGPLREQPDRCPIL